MSLIISENPLINNNKESEFFGNGEFEFADNWSRPYFQSAHQAISRCELWNWLRNYEPEEDKGFVFTIGVPELDKLSEEMNKDPVNDGHSGASYGCTMRNMEYIAKHGYEAFKAEVTRNKV